MKRTSILLVDDNREFVDSTQELLNILGCEVTTSYSVAEAKMELSKKNYTHLLLDMMLPDGSGLNILEALPHSRILDISITIMTGHPTVRSTITKFYGPRLNFLLKPITLDKLKVSIDLGSSTFGNNRDDGQLHKIIGRTKLIKDLKESIKIAAASNANIMIFGESGTGKELVAQSIHGLSNATGELIATNCGSFNRELISSELFGHEKGAFTGASNTKVGLFENAHGSNLFLDEITEMPIEQQPHLLRALETKTIKRVGGLQSIPADCRVISATNRSEHELFAEDILREDLYYRLAVFPIYVPPLKDRRDDIEVLLNHFVEELQSIGQEDLRLRDEDLLQLENYSWPGNIRELKHVVYRALLTTPRSSQYLKLPASFSSPYSAKEEMPEAQFQVGRSLEEIEKEFIFSTLHSYAGDRQKTAEVLGISQKTLYNRLKSYKVQLENESK